MDEKTGRRRLSGRGVWQQFTIQDGLPDMKIECLYEDSQGILWIGTHDRGVVRYDGREFETFTRRDGLSGDGVFSIVEDQAGTLWFGTNSGITRRYADHFESVGPDRELGVLWGRHVDQDGSVWFGLDRRPGSRAALIRCKGDITELVELGDDVIDEGNSIHQITSCGEGQMLFGGHGLYQSDAGRCSQLGSVESIGDVKSILVANDITLIATDFGLFSMSGDMVRISDLTTIEALAVDMQGVVWATTYDGGLMRFEEGEFVSEIELAAICWRALAIDTRGRFWIGTYGMGLFCYDRSQFTLFTTQQGLPSNVIKCVTSEDCGHLWAGTTGGLVGVAPDDEVPIKESLFGNHEVTALLVGRDKVLRIGTRNGTVFTKRGDVVANYETVPGVDTYSISVLT